MARSINRLSARTVETIAKPGRHADGGNLFLVVDAARENGSPRKPARRWAFIFRWDGKLKEMGLGSLNAISLARARELAGQYRTVLAENRNPIEVRRAEERKRVAGRTFGEVATELHSSLQSGWRGVKYRQRHGPHPIRQSEFHRRSDSQRLVHTTEIVVRHEQGHGGSVRTKIVPDFREVCVSQSWYR